MFVKRFDHFSDFSFCLISPCLKVFVDLVSSGWHAGCGVVLTVLSIGIRNVGVMFELDIQNCALEEQCFFHLWLKCRYQSHGKSDYCSVTPALHFITRHFISRLPQCVHQELAHNVLEM